MTAKERRRFGKRKLLHRNPLTSTEDLLLGGTAIGILALVGWAVYSKSQLVNSLPATNVPGNVQPYINQNATYTPN
jgi:CDP-diglyceride synthetase